MEKKRYFSVLPLRHGKNAAQVLLCLALFPAILMADLLVYEGFDYVPGPLAGKTGGKGWTEIWKVPAGAAYRDMECREGSLSYGPLETSGNRAFAERAIPGPNPSPFGIVERSVANLPLGGGKTDLWLSMLVRIETGGVTEGWFGMKTSTQNNYWFGLNANQKTYGMELPSVNSLIPFTTNGVDLLVMKLHVRPDGKLDKFLWVNPPHTALGGADLDPQSASLTSLAATPVEAVSRLIVTCSNQGDLDEIRAGDTFADVTPIKVLPGPEPAVAAIQGTPRWVNGLPAGELESVEPAGVNIRSTRGTRTLVPWSSLSPATRYRLQPDFRNQLPDQLKGKPATATDPPPEAAGNPLWPAP